MLTYKDLAPWLACLFFMVYSLGLSLDAVAQSESKNNRLSDLTEMSLEDLLSVQVTSVSKKKEKRSEAAAAIYVITKEAIRRSPATTLPDLLRSVPGLQVAQLDGNKWAISARGFNERFSNKLLVLIDGRSIYSPLFAGVFWELHDIALEDIERIEVIRGPGGTLWGANAVNGVINITTQHAAESQGGMLSLLSGTKTDIQSVARYGGAFSEQAHYRLTLKYADRQASEYPNGDSAQDTWDSQNLQFRTDWQFSEEDTLFFSAGLFDINQGQTYRFATLWPPYRYNRDSSREQQGGHVQLRWDRQVSEESDFTLQLYFNREDRQGETLNELRSTYDIDFQYHTKLSEGHDLVWGLEGRYTEDTLSDSFWVSMEDKRHRDRLFSGFIQDEMLFLEERLRLTLGAKIEHNDYSGVEFQPSLRLAWVPNEHHTLWGALSRAVRTPSRIERDGRLNSFTLPMILGSLYGQDSFDSTELLAHELGWRYSPGEKTALEVSLFYNDYDNLRTFNLGLPFPEAFPCPPHITVPFYTTNDGSAYTYGVEISADYMLKNWWKVHGSYVYTSIKTNSSGFYTLFADSAEGETPRHQIRLESHMDLPHKTELDLLLSYVDELSSIDIDSYWDFDVRLGWRPRDTLEISLVGENLLESNRQEYDARYVNTLPTVVERGVYAKVDWRF